VVTLSSDPSLAGASQRRLAWARVREQGFHFLLISPVLFLMVMFFVFPLLTLLARSFQDGPKGIPIVREPVQLLPGDHQAFRLAHVPLADRNGDGRVDVADLEAEAVRSVPISALEPGTGQITLAGVPPEGETILVSYNDFKDEIGIRRQADSRIFKVANPPVREPSGVSVKLERPVAIASVDPKAGIIVLISPPAANEQIVVTYNYRDPFSLAQYAKALRDHFYWDWRFWRPSLFRTTFEIALFTSLGCTLIGYPVAYFLANISTRWRTLLVPLVVIPFWTSTLVRSFAWQLILGKTGPINTALMHIGIVHAPLALVFNRLGVFVGMIHVLLPYVILPALTTMLGMPQYPLRAAASLGASPTRVFFRVYLPLSLPGVAVGSLLVFIVSLGFFVTPALLGSGPDRMMVNMIDTQINMNGNWEFGSALSFLLLTPTILLYLVYVRVVRLGSLYDSGERNRLLFGMSAAGDGIDRIGSPFLKWIVWKKAIVSPLVFLGRIGGKLCKIAQEQAEAVPFGVQFVLAVGASTAIALALALWVYRIPLLLVGMLLGGLPPLLLFAFAMSRLLRIAFSRLVHSAFALLVLGYLISANLIVIPVSFTNHPVFLDFPGRGFTLRNFASFFGVAGASHFGATGWMPATFTSLQVAIMVVLVSVPLGSLAAYGIVRGNFSGRNLLLYLIILPLMIPHLITGIALFMFFSRYMRFMLGSVATLGPIQIPLGFVIGHSLLAIPFVILVSIANLKSVDPILERAAMSLGASPLMTLRRVVLPLIAPGMVVSGLLAFLTSFDELLIALFLSTPRVTTLPKRMWDGLQNEIDPTITAISTMLIFLTIIIVSAAALSQRYLARDRSG
jgi:putative spermidine/putrescine transport system permease protein